MGGVGGKLTGLAQFSAKACGHGLRGALYWLVSGVVGRARPRVPHRYGRGPYNDARRYALDLCLYPFLAVAWLVGAACRAVRRRDGPRVAGTMTVAAAWDGVRHLPILDPDECASIASQVCEMREHWIFRQPGFYTLGYAAYMDCRDPQRRLRYFDDAPRLNRVLADRFEPVYRRVLAVLEAELAAPFSMAEEQAIPGFHVWLGPGIPHRGFDAGSVHFDLQYLDNGLGGDGRLTAAEVLSVTLPVRLPKAGGGLNIWNVRYPEPAGPEVWPFTKMAAVHYEIGSLVLHSGHELHQIAPAERIEDGDERICLQGHAVRQNGRWLLYW